MSEGDGSPDPKYLAMRVGVVAQNDDPEKLGRVRIRIPGLIDTMSGWALPIGGPGGGSAKRGFFDVPAVGAELAVFFNEGDPDQPRYLPGNWGRGEQPTYLADVDVADAPKVHAYETDRWSMTFDDRAGKELLQLKDKKTGDVIEIDGVGLGVNIEATAMVNIKCTGLVNISGLAVTINGRPVSGVGPI